MGWRAALTQAVKTFRSNFDPTVIFLVSDDKRLVNQLIKGNEDLPLIVATSNRELITNLKERGQKTKRLTDPLRGDVNILPQVKDMLVSAMAEDILQRDDRIVAIIGGEAVPTMFCLSGEEMGVARLKDQVKDWIDIRILETVLTIAFEIAEEGREGTPQGCIFVLGDSDTVMEQSRQLVLNPFQGHPETRRYVLDNENWETVKEFSMLDGAFIIDERGVAQAAGRYLHSSEQVDQTSGLGGRHLAACSITKSTRAITVTVSTSGVVRVWKDGQEIFKVSAR